MKQLIIDTKAFAEKILRLVPSTGPWYLSEKRSKARAEHIEEELKEFLSSSSPTDQADALIDIIYIAAGALAEMGVTPEQATRAWVEVHRANMRKINGSLSKRPNAGNHDAVKPQGWTGPDWYYIASGNRDVRPAPRSQYAPGNQEAVTPSALNSEVETKTVGKKICEDRAHRYGSFWERAEMVDKITDALESHPHWNTQLGPEHRHALRMIAEKMGRIVVGNEPDYADNWDDIGGYAHLGKEGK